jgi:hypothetical protein
MLRSIVDWEVNAGFLISLLFPIVTRLYWPWNESWWGINIIALEMAIAGTLFPSFVFLDFGVDDLALRWFQVVSLGAVIATLIWRAVMIWLTQWNGRVHDLEKTEDHSL